MGAGYLWPTVGLSALLVSWKKTMGILVICGVLKLGDEFMHTIVNYILYHHKLHVVPDIDICLVF